MKPEGAELLPAPTVADVNTPKPLAERTAPIPTGLAVKLVFSWYWLFAMIGTTEMPFAPALAGFAPLGSDTIKMPRANRVATGNSFQDNFMAMLQPPKETIPRPAWKGLSARKCQRLCGNVPRSAPPISPEGA